MPDLGFNLRREPLFRVKKLRVYLFRAIFFVLGSNSYLGQLYYHPK